MSHEDLDQQFIAEFNGECAGVGLSDRGDNHVMFSVLVEDDGNWFTTSATFSSAWLDELIGKLTEARSHMSKRYRREIPHGGYRFSKRRG